MKNWRERVDKQTKEKVIEEMRNWLEVQFKYKMYNDPCFPFFQAMGRQNVFQNFVDKNVGKIGTLHLKWYNEDNGIVYDAPRATNVIGTWKSTWYDEKEGAELAMKEFLDTPIDFEKLNNVIIAFRESKIQPRQEEKNPDIFDPILN